MVSGNADAPADGQYLTSFQSSAEMNLLVSDSEGEGVACMALHPWPMLVRKYGGCLVKAMFSLLQAA